MVSKLRQLASAWRLRIAHVDPVVWVALAVGLVLRVWRFGELPPGLNQDEASMAYDAYCLGHFGIDRHGYRFPMMLVSWGSGMYALAAYVALPFIRLFGLSVFSARLPFLLLGLAALPLFYALLLHTTDRRTARIGVVLLAISPWHVMVSRWALDSNLLPFVFLLATVLLVRATERPRYLIGAAACYALTLYAYGTAYLVVPVFAALALAHGLRHRLWPRATLLASAAVFVVFALPVALYVAINNLGWPALTTPLFSIPRLTGVARYQTMGNLRLSAEFFRKAGENLADAGRMFWQQDDGLIWNAIPGYGILFPLSTFLALAGLALLVDKHLRRSGQRTFTLLAWCLAAAALMAFVSPNINRLNIAMLPFIYCVAVALSALWHRRAIVVMVGVVFAASLVGFVGNYFGPYRGAAADPFFASFGEAIRHASAQTDGEVCVTGQVNMPYIFVLFYNREDPHGFARTAHIDNPGAEFQSVSAFGRYRFGLDRCAEGAKVIIATNGEAERFPADRFIAKRFERFTVLTRTD